uniref:Uncharacterized protein n=1 Tax=Lactuca sativa TaxID=4236 RepID=A0A9R1X994_LACSA|nr:hypothetical protein LSAT_V11C500258580 [Lactuca sativa]
MTHASSVELLGIRKGIILRFRKSRELKANKIVLHVGNGEWDAIQEIGHFYLCLPFCMDLTLINVCLITYIIKKIILVSHLIKFAFKFQFVNDDVHSFLDGIFYFEARPINRIYELNLDETSKK